MGTIKLRITATFSREFDEADLQDAMDLTGEETSSEVLAAIAHWLRKPENVAEELYDLEVGDVIIGLVQE